MLRRNIPLEVVSRCAWLYLFLGEGDLLLDGLDEELVDVQVDWNWANNILSP